MTDVEILALSFAGLAAVCPIAGMLADYLTEGRWYERLFYGTLSAFGAFISIALYIAAENLS